jgi:hypothetical protein
LDDDGAMADTSLLPAGTVPPSELRTADAWLRRQRAEDAVADHEAVMASKEALRVWCDGTWPEDGFTLEENVEDLAGHIEDAATGTAYGYTIWDPTGERVLGSLYLEPTAPFLDDYVVDEATRAALATCDVRIELWLRADLPEDVEPRVLAAVRDWLADAWPFRRPGWGSRRGMHGRRAHLEALGFGEVAALVSRDGARRFHVHALPA